MENQVFGFSTFDDVIKIEPGQNPFAKLVANGEQVNEDLLLINDVLEVKKEAEDCSTRISACKNCTCKKSTYLLIYFFILLESKLEKIWEI